MALKSKQETKEIEGVKFIFQHPGLEAVLDMKERAKDPNGNTSDKELYNEMFEHVVFAEIDGSPQKVNFNFFEENFDSMKVFTEVMKTAFRFIFR